LIEVRSAAGEQEVAWALELRERVFVGEQGVAPEADRDGHDADALHIAAFEDGRLVGTCRLVCGDGAIARLGRMAVEPASRNRGIGRAILETAEEAARERGAIRIRLHAQIAALPLYERAGYTPRGDMFMEEGIEHQTMERALA
jgi:predicted GNAT family N-acyltransferase